MLILVTNDDGIRAAGIAALSEAMAEFGEVAVVAPDREQSAASHSISLHRPLRIENEGHNRHTVDGTPTDCVYLALHHVLQGRKPDLLVSGINHGGNIADDVSYSGTVSAAIEGTIFGIPSFAISLATRGPFEFEPAQRAAKIVAREILAHGLPKDVFLNVNVPRLAHGAPIDLRVTRLGKRTYGQHVEARKDPRGKDYFWIGGGEMVADRIDGSDCVAVLDKCVSVTPLTLDHTSYATLDSLRGWRLSAS